MRSPAGEPINAIYGYTNFLIQILQEYPDYLAVTFDGSLTTSFRNEIYPEYKAQRAETPAELKQQMQQCQDITAALGMPCFVDTRFESDDLIGTLWAQIRDWVPEIQIVSSDKDFAQLVDERTSLWDFARDRRFDAAAVYQKFGVPPHLIVDLFALMGDSVDNIPGVKGVGAKTAGVLLRHFGSLEQLYRDIDGFDGEGIRGWASVKEKLRAGREQAELSRKLACICHDAPLSVTLDDLKYDGPNQESLTPLLAELGIHSLAKRIPN